MINWNIDAFGLTERNFHRAEAWPTTRDGDSLQTTPWFSYHGHKTSCSIEATRMTMWLAALARSRPGGHHASRA